MNCTSSQGLSALVLALMWLPASALPNAADSVAQVVRESTQDNTRMSSCVLLAKANQPSPAQEPGARKKALEQLSQKLKLNEVSILRARGDVARKGLYGYPQDPAMALRMYEKASKSAEAGWNAALMQYRSARGAMSPQVAKRILAVMQKSGASMPNSRGVVGAHAHYVAGLLHETGAAGTPDARKAFIHYRASARNAYVPGAYHYMRMLSQSLTRLPEAERNVVLQEMRMMMNRWKWQSPEIMLLMGDMYAGKWFPDEGGFLSQHHWRMAMRMGGATEIADFETFVKQRLKRLSPAKEKQLEEAVEAGMRNTIKVKHELEYSDLCAE